ncbi:MULTISPECIES: hypothetical protein [unclassified Myroides]|uniref:hypothetical protein n=1 Tax=unclassified Myroides TaxID=2642485 RepID=UPI003D2F5B32
MKKNNPWKIGMCLLLLFCTFVGYGQRIQKDIFNDLIFKEGQYEAKLKKDIFDHLLFTDSNDNKIEFNKAYLEQNIGNMYQDYDVKSLFFQDLVLDYRHISGYEASYKVDILGTLTITDNQGKTVKSKVDIFGNLKIDTTDKRHSSSIGKNLAGDLEYSSGRQWANLKKNYSNSYIYTDSNKTKIEIPEVIWERFMDRYKSEYAIFEFLLVEFLLNRP